MNDAAIKTFDRVDEWDSDCIIGVLPTWQTKANCIGHDTDLWFPPRGGSTKEPKEVCAACEVREECLEFALANGEKFGIWGGMSERERRRIRRERALAAGAKPLPAPPPRIDARGAWLTALADRKWHRSDWVAATVGTERRNRQAVSLSLRLAIKAGEVLEERHANGESMVRLAA